MRAEPKVGRGTNIPSHNFTPGLRSIFVKRKPIAQLLNANRRSHYNRAGEARVMDVSRRMLSLARQNHTFERSEGREFGKTRSNGGWAACVCSAGRKECCCRARLS